MNLYTMQKVSIRNDCCIDIKSEKIRNNYSCLLSHNQAEFVRRAGDNAGAFTVEGIGAAKLLLLYNSETGEVFIPETYSEEERFNIRRKFIQFLLNEPKVTYKFIEME